MTDAKPPSSSAASAAAATTSTTPRSPRRVLVTGVTGQDGSYLAEQLLAAGAAVFGLVRGEGAALPAGVTPLPGDLRDQGSLRRALDAAEPDQVFNLAAASFVPDSWKDPGLVEDINAGGVERLLGAIDECGASIRFCQASSAEIFGAPTGRAQDEDDELAPITPYGESKARAHRFVARMRQERGLFASSAILFNHESPRRPPRFVTRRITMAAARIARGLEETITLGNLDAARDWGYAPEYVAAMREMLLADRPGDYVVATGQATTVGEFARLAFARVGLDWQRHVHCDAGLARPADSLARLGDPSRIARELGWRARTSVEQLVALMVDADLALLDHPAAEQ